MTGNLVELVSPEEIGSLVRGLAEQIGRDYHGRRPVLVSVLKGAFVFTADLARAIEIDVEVDFIQPSSYGNGSVPAEDVALIRRLGGDIRGRDVIIVEGIVDRGHTLRRVMEEIRALGPASIKVCSLLVRKGLGHEVSVDYRGMVIPGGFVVGYGMDLGGKYRNLGGIYTIKEKGWDHGHG